MYCLAVKCDVSTDLIYNVLTPPHPEGVIGSYRGAFAGNEQTLAWVQKL